MRKRGERKHCGDDICVPRRRRRRSREKPSETSEFHARRKESGRGFSFMRDEPLLMTFAKDSNTDAVTAETILNEWKEETLVTLLKGYGEERYAKRIAGAIIAARAKTPIRTTGELRAIIESAISRHRKV